MVGLLKTSQEPELKPLKWLDLVLFHKMYSWSESRSKRFTREPRISRILTLDLSELFLPKDLDTWKAIFLLLLHSIKESTTHWPKSMDSRANGSWKTQPCQQSNKISVLDNDLPEATATVLVKVLVKSELVNLMTSTVTDHLSRQVFHNLPTSAQSPGRTPSIS